MVRLHSLDEQQSHRCDCFVLLQLFHPTEPLLIAADDGSEISVWNYKQGKKVRASGVCPGLMFALARTSSGLCLQFS